MAKQLRWMVAVLALLVAAGGLTACGGDDGGSGEASETEDTEAEDRSDDAEEPEEDAEDEESGEDEDAEDEDPDEDSDDEEGGLEGDREDTFDDFTDDAKEEMGPVDEGSESYGDYTQVFDESGYLATDIPTAWTDVDPAFGLFGPSIVASTDRQAFREYRASGLTLQVSSLAPGQTEVEVLRAISGAERQNCTSTPRDPYQDDVLIGTVQVFVDCAGTTTDVIWMTFTTYDDVNHGFLGIAVTSDADFEAFEYALAGLTLDASA